MNREKEISRMRIARLKREERLARMRREKEIGLMKRISGRIRKRKRNKSEKEEVHERNVLRQPHAFSYVENSFQFSLNSLFSFLFFLFQISELLIRYDFGK